MNPIRPLTVLLLVAPFISVAPVVAPRTAVGDEIATINGRTMGTTYTVKIHDPPTNLDDIRIAVDDELREVNDQMSTYLQTSEITRFNDSESTDWFDVSTEFAAVVDAAKRIAAASGGALDVTVGPAIDAWDFGAGEASASAVPDASELEALRQYVGDDKLSVRPDPPAIRKSHPRLRIDLSAIAKGHGVDRVVGRLEELGCEDVFVEIGGEVRVAGDKDGVRWKVGIEQPDAGRGKLLAAHSLGYSESDVAMATSGDYRNYREIDGVRYSHTLDPTTLSPIRHQLAAVTVIAGDCMTADGWATAFNVAGPERGLELARRHGIEALLITRGDDGFRREATGSLIALVSEPQADDPSVGRDPPGSAATPLAPMFLATLAVVLVVIAGMAIGVMFGRKSLAGSCGGVASLENDDGTISCSLCNNPSDGCKDLREKLRRDEAERRRGMMSGS